MVLVQRRGPIFDAVIRALKRARVPVAGADLLRIGGELAVSDLLAALRVAATPRDDLSLAAFLRSPLGGLTERELFDLAHARAGSLWQALAARRRTAGPSRARSSTTCAPRPTTSALRAPRPGCSSATTAAAGSSPASGPEAEDGIDALLDQALAYESVEPPTLTGFLDWFDRDEVAVKRRTEEGADQVPGDDRARRQGPRGADRHPARHRRPQRRLEPAAGPPPRGRPGGLARPARRRPGARRRRGRAAGRSSATRTAACSTSRSPARGAGSSSAAPASGRRTAAARLAPLVADAMPRSAPPPSPGPDGETLALSTAGGAVAAAVPAPASGPPLPGWSAPPRPGPPRPRLLSPSAPRRRARAWPARRSASPGGGPRARHRRAPPARAPARPARRRTAPPRGACCPDRPTSRRCSPRPPASSTPPASPSSPPASLAEVEVAAPPGRGARIGGRIDRLVVAAERVLAVDFKSHRVVPAAPEDVPEGILRQLGAYRAALAPIWPDRPVETAVLWTRPARLMPPPAALADAAFARAILDRRGSPSIV